MDPRPYRSIFLSDDWVSLKYLGWSLNRDRAGLRVWRKRYGPIERHFLLLTSDNDLEICEYMKNIGLRLALSEIVIHDFNNALAPTPAINTMKFSKLGKGQSILNIASYVIDLHEDADTLWKKFAQNSRRKIHRAEALGLRFRAEEGLSSALPRFFEFYAQLARKNRLPPVPRSEIVRMATGGDLTTVCCCDARGDIELVNLIYKAGKSAYALYGASADERTTGAGQFTEWRSIMYLKDLGYEWYDLGGVSDKIEVDGIHRFKRSMGGQFVDLGAEYRWQGVLCASAKRASTWPRRVIARLRA